MLTKAKVVAKEYDVRDRIPVPNDNSLNSIFGSHTWFEGYFYLLVPCPRGLLPHSLSNKVSSLKYPTSMTGN